MVVYTLISYMCISYAWSLGRTRLGRTRCGEPYICGANNNNEKKAETNVIAIRVVSLSLSLSLSLCVCLPACVRVIVLHMVNKTRGITTMSSARRASRAVAADGFFTAIWRVQIQFLTNLKIHNGNYCGTYEHIVWFDIWIGWWHSLLLRD